MKKKNFFDLFAVFFATFVFCEDYKAFEFQFKGVNISVELPSQYEPG